MPGSARTSVRTQTNSDFTPTVDTARTFGITCAHDWLTRSANPAKITAGSLPAWRASCYAAAVHEYEDVPGFLVLLAEWEKGFDATIQLSTGDLPSSEIGAAGRVPEEKDIKWICGSANALTALLEALDMIPERNQLSVVRTAADIAEGIAIELNVFVRGAK